MRAEGAGWSSPSRRCTSSSALVLDAVGAAASELRRSSSLRPTTPTLPDAWQDDEGGTRPRRAGRLSLSSSSGGASSLPSSLRHEDAGSSSVLLGADPPDDDVAALRQALTQMQLRLTEADQSAASLAAELGSREQSYTDHLSAQHLNPAAQLRALEAQLRAEVRRPTARRPTAPLALLCRCGRASHPRGSPMRHARAAFRTPARR